VDMIGCIKMPRGHILGFVRAVSRVAVCAVLLASCSSVPDAINPVEWYKGASDFVTGKDKPEVAKSTTEAKTEAKAEPRKEPAKGLVADRGNAQYATPVRREVTPTKQLAKRQAPAATQVAEAADSKPVTDGSVTTPRPAPKTVASAELPPPAPAAAPQQVRDTGPAALDNTPPARPDIPETVPGPKVKPVHAHYQKRLAESAGSVVRPGIVDSGFGPQLASADEPIHLVPPSSRKKKAGGGKGMAAPAPEAPAASFQVAALNFRGGSAELTAADREAIAQTARLYRQSGGGVVRVVGLAPSYSAESFNQMMDGFDASLKRANAVARELTKRGVPAGKIMVGADPAAGATETVGAKIFLDVI
jgi:outer membrane protein OmpA-like peptidoglycan-associated protein